MSKSRAPKPAIEKAQQKVAALEVELRRSAAEVLQDGDYESGRRIAAIAERLSHLAGAPPREDTSSPGQAARRPLAIPGDTSFVRSGDMIFRLGKQRKGNGTYRHRVPISVVDAVAGRAEQWTRAHALMSAEDFTQAASVGGTIPPQYQVYGAMKWLEQLGILRRHGRRGYSVPDPKAARNVMQSALDELPTVSEEEV